MKKLNKKLNKNIINEFEKLIEFKLWELNNASDRQQKIHKSYSLEQTKNVLKTLKLYPKEINEKELKKLSDIKGIGKKSIQRIKEIIENKNLSELEEFSKQKNYQDYIDKLQQIIGIGKAKAHELITKYKINSIDELKKAIKSGKLKVNEKIKLGLKYLDKHKQEIPRDEITLINDYLHKMYSKVDINLFGVICGSYRRLKSYSGDIDVLLIHPKIKTKKQLKTHKVNYLNELVKVLKKDKFLIDDLTDKNVTTKYMGFCKLKNNPIRRIDIRYIPYESYYAALLYFTGNGNFNKRMREVAISFGYKLNEYGLFLMKDDKEVKMLKADSEKDIFDALSMEYIAPENRH